MFEENTEVNRKKVALFVCDVLTTIPDFQNEDIKNKKLISLLEQLRIKHNADELIFSYSTIYGNKEYLFQHVDKMKEHLNDESIVLGNQSTATEIYDCDGNLIPHSSVLKYERILYYVSQLEEEAEVVFLGFADKGISRHTIEVLQEELPYVKNIYGFIPGRRNYISNLTSESATYGIDGIIKTMENYLDDNIKKECFGILGEHVVYCNKVGKSKVLSL